MSGAVDMKEVWQCQMDMLQSLLKVCQRHGLRVWIDAGTLLGAVRHKGFIPWDDDIDVVLLREDYDQLMQLHGEFTHPLFLQNAYTDPTYLRGHAQLRDSLTAAIIPGEERQRFNQGIFIDIFALDAIPEEAALRVQERKARRMRKLMLTKYYWYEPQSRLKRTAAHAVALAEKAFVNDQRLFSRYEQLFRQYSTDQYEWLSLNMFSFDHMDHFRRRRSCYDQTVWLPFEQMEVPCPEGYDEVLRGLYGDDYMTPQQAPSLHGGGIMFDTRRSYKEIINH